MLHSDLLDLHLKTPVNFELHFTSSAELLMPSEADYTSGVGIILLYCGFYSFLNAVFKWELICSPHLPLEGANAHVYSRYCM